MPDKTFLQSLERRWKLRIGEPFSSDPGGAWVAPAVRAGGSPVVLKICCSHMEARDELKGLRFWNGDPTVYVLDADDETGAILLERCHPGTPLRSADEHEQDIVIAGLLRRLWRRPVSSEYGFRPLTSMLDYWSQESLAGQQRWLDAGLVREGLRLFAALPQSAETQVLLATDLHAGNVLRSQREPWLVIDPKPFVGDPAYDLTQHLLNCRSRLRADPRGAIQRLADLANVDEERVSLWLFARAAAEPRDEWDDELTALARLLVH